MDSPEKLAALEQMAAESPDDALIHFMLGSQQMLAGQYAEAATSLTRCLELNPDHTAAARLLGDAWRKQGKNDEAREAYARTIEIAERTGELQAAKEARALMRKLK
jgi:Flp pilus assembly protein TadD